MEVKHEQSVSKGTFYIDGDQRRLAQMFYSNAGDRIIISHTEVRDALKGKGAGRQLVAAGVAFARENNLKIVPLCPFARAIIQKTPEFQEVL